MVAFLRIVACVYLMHSTSVYAWNALAHRLIAQIACDNLTPAKKRELAHINQTLNQHRKRLSLVNASVWLDTLYAVNFTSIKAMHYIDIPFSNDGTSLPSIKKTNAVWAIRMAASVLANPDATMLDKSIALRILIHVVGDVHQPMHAVSLVNKNYPKGDRGGNLVALQKNLVATNLHAYWDKGAGLFTAPKAYKQTQLKRFARQIEQQYPCDLTVVVSEPLQWAQESHEIAKNIAYELLKGHTNYNYQTTVQRIAMQRVAIAGCRLAAYLNKVNLSKKAG